MLPRTYVSRPRLLEKLSQAIQCKLTIVCADAGYGKTSLVTEFTRAASLRSEWYHLAGTDRDVVRLAEGLEGCLRRLATDSEPGGTGRTRLQRAKAQGIPILTEVLLRQARRVGPETVLLVLDDYQNVDLEADVNLLLGSLIENSPASLHFVVLSRGVPRFSLARLKARQELCILGEEDLSFRMEETASFLGGQQDCELDDGAMALVQERTEGWPAGIAMVSQSLRYGRQDRVMSVLADPVSSMWLVYDYLAEEVFDRQPVAVREFLLNTSVLGAMDSALCNHLLSLTSSQRTLLALEEGGLFTASVDASRQTFRYHQLFREFLRQKLHQLESEEAVKALHTRAAQYYESHHRWEDCVDHYLKAGEPAKAAQVVEAIGEKYALAGLFQTVDRWLRALPEDLTANRPWLLMLRARLSHMSVRNEESLRLLERALRGFQAMGNDHGEAYALGEIAFVKYRSHQIHQAIRHFELALSKAEGDSSLKASILVGQHVVYMYAGRFDDSAETYRATCDEAEAISEELQRLQIRSRAARDRAIVLMEQGDLDSARRAVQEALDLCLSHNLGEYEHSRALIHLGAVLWAHGSFDESIEALNRALSMSGRHIQQMQERIGSRLGNALRDTGRLAEAERAYALGGWEADFEAAFLALLTHQVDAARSRAEALYRQWHISENIMAKSSAEVVLALVLRESGDAAGALEHIRKGTSILKEGGYRFRWASALLHQARIEYESSLPEAPETLARALEVSSTGNYYHFFWWETELVAFLCQRAMEQGILPEYAYRLAERRLGQARVRALAHLPSSQRTEMSQQPVQEGLLPIREMPGDALAELLVECGDPHIRNSLQQAVDSGVVSAEGLHILRKEYGLTWREIEVLLEYYLRPATIQPSAGNTPLRIGCARSLGISGNTVRCHVSSIRGKLGLPRSLSGRDILAWAELQGLRPSAASRC